MIPYKKINTGSGNQSNKEQNENKYETEMNKRYSLQVHKYICTY